MDIVLNKHVVTARFCGFFSPSFKVTDAIWQKVNNSCISFVVVAMLWLQVAKSNPFIVKKHVPHYRKDRRSVKPGYSE